MVSGWVGKCMCGHMKQQRRGKERVGGDTEGKGLALLE